MKQVEEREKLIGEVNEILSKKEFTDQAKNDLLETILSIYDHYNPPLYVKMTKKDYIHAYLKILEDMKGYSILTLDDLNAPVEIKTAKVFRLEIKETENQDGSLDCIDGKFVFAKKGAYYPDCKGFSWNRKHMMFSLEEENKQNMIATCYEEMTHLGEGTKAFLLDSMVPLAYELRKMCYEGHVAARESYLNLKSSKYKIEKIKEGDTLVKICSEHSYPLYGMLYTILQLLFGVELLEDFSANSAEDLDVLDILMEKFKDVSVEYIFAHIIYILNSYKEYDIKQLEKAIDNYSDYQKLLLEQMIKKCESLKEKIDSDKQWLEDNQKIEKETMEKLEDPKRLEQAFEYQMTLVREETLKKYKEGIISEEEYNKAIEEYDEQGTLENYRLAQKQDLKMLGKSLKDMEERIEKETLELEKIMEKKKRLEENRFVNALREVCIKTPSLIDSFEYLKQSCTSKIGEDYFSLPKEKQEEEEEHNKYLDKIKVFMHIKSQMVFTSETINIDWLG